MTDKAKSAPVIERRSTKRTSDEKWRTALTCIEPNKILVRGYPLDEMMGRLTFGEAIYLLFMGEVPSPAIGSLMEAMLVSFIDHGATPPSTLAARNTATTGAPLRACVAAGVLGFGRFHGGDIEACMGVLDSGLELVRNGAVLPRRRRPDRRAVPADRRRDPRLRPPVSHAGSARGTAVSDGARTRGRRAPRADDPRRGDDAGGTPADRRRRCRSTSTAQSRRCAATSGIPPIVANALFIISRVPGIAAQAREESERCHPMRQIDPKDHLYDGPSQRRLPERRK